MTKKSGIIIGTFYETPDGRIARTHGWDGGTKRVSYALNDGEGGRSIPESEALSGWTRRPDLSDFPDASDPVLPAIFDLVLDIRHRSQLVALLAAGEDEIRELMSGNGIVLTESESATIEHLRADAANDVAMGL